MPTLFDPLQLGSLNLKNRCVLSPMTRERCGIDGIPTELHAEYFAQRAGAGLVISGNCRVSANGACSPHSTGMHTDAQVAGWRRVTNAVHAAGGIMFAQIFHAGAGGHPDIVLDAGYPVAPSAIPWGGEVRTMHGNQPCLVPRALEAHEIGAITGEFVQAAQRAIAAGFDGVEVHACSGYLLEEFLCSRTNRRTDHYGGSIQNRCRFLFEVFEAVASVAGADRTGVKISPEFNRYDTVVDDHPQETFSYLAQALSDFKPAYLAVADNSAVVDYHALLRPLFRGIYMAGVDFTPERALSYIRDGKADLIAFGRPFISNPDLPERIRRGAALNPVDSDTRYKGGARGLVDYPTLEPQAAQGS
jgi:N-ethylmaleimide reductase